MTETELKKELGLSDSQMRAAREKLPGAWERTAHGQIVWTEDGLTLLLNLLEKKEARPAVLSVTRLPINKSTVFADADGTEVLVTGVRDNRLLSPRQKITAVQQPDGRWLWHGPHATRKGQILVRPPAHQ